VRRATTGRESGQAQRWKAAGGCAKRCLHECVSSQLTYILCGFQPSALSVPLSGLSRPPFPVTMSYQGLRGGPISAAPHHGIATIVPVPS
jgi:hypothetical protein